MKPTQPTLLTRRHFLQIVGGGAASLALLSACVPAAPAAQAPTAASAPDSPQRGGALRVAFSDSISSLQPYGGVTYADSAFGWSIYENLTYTDFNDPNYTVKPLLAESWEASADSLTWSFTIRQGVTFHHGTPLTAKDVVAAIQLIMNPATAAVAAGQLGGVSAVELADEQTVRFTLKAPNVDFARTVATAALWIVPPDRTLEQLTAEPSGTGPYKFQSHTPGERAVFVRNESYWDSALPYLDELQLLFMPEMTAQLAALSSDTVDALVQVPAVSLAELEGNPDLKVIENPLGSYHVFVMRVDQKPFDDVRVRQALKHAVDRAGMRQAVLQGRGALGNDQPVVAASPFWADIPPLAYDVEKAKSLLAEAGYPDGVEVTLAVADIGPGLTDAAVALQEMVKAAGFTITLDKVDAGSYWTTKYMQAPFFVSIWPGQPIPGGDLMFGYHSTGAFNESGWQNPDLDALIEGTRAEADEAKRKAIFADLQTLISSEGAVLIPYYIPQYLAVRSTVHDMPANVLPNLRAVWVG